MIYAYDFTNLSLVSFSAATPGTLISNTPLIGLGITETLVGIDFRPATGQLYGMASDGTTERV